MSIEIITIIKLDLATIPYKGNNMKKIAILVDTEIKHRTLDNFGWRKCTKCGQVGKLLKSDNGKVKIRHIKWVQYYPTQRRSQVTVCCAD